ncbi:11418_t:CDS:2 [Ambispora gerdemannii]|uniref:11418_t:CDS:1 n=1 Tax=Ambispora gerdemannii TaxID=144530 RepID=A0A9N9DB31_9GLOM|nr:11418_t:CDS:2 [Ambispora gerdemannii]
MVIEIEMIADATVKVSATTSSKNDYGLCPACDRPKTSSNWCPPCHFEWNNKDKKYFRESWKDYPIALKFFHNTPDIAATFLNEIKVHHKCMMQQGNGFLQCYGVSRHPVTMEFITVLDFAQHGDFRNFLRQNHKTLKWEDKLSFATKIADDLKIIHDSDFVHGDFHSGNVLQVSTTPSVSDFGLSHEDKDYVPEADEMIKTNNGVIPTDNPKAIYSSRYIPFTKQHDNTMQHDTIQHDFATDDLTMCYGFDIDG